MSVHPVWSDNANALNKWFAIQAASDVPTLIQDLQQLHTHPDFSVTNPNRVRSVFHLSVYCSHFYTAGLNSSGHFIEHCMETFLTIRRTSIVTTALGNHTYFYDASFSFFCSSILISVDLIDLTYHFAKLSNFLSTHSFRRYKFLADAILDLDKVNSRVAAQMAKQFSQWKR